MLPDPKSGRDLTYYMLLGLISYPCRAASILGGWCDRGELADSEFEIASRYEYWTKTFILDIP